MWNLRFFLYDFCYYSLNFPRLDINSNIDIFISTLIYNSILPVALYWLTNFLLLSIRILSLWIFLAWKSIEKERSIAIKQHASRLYASIFLNGRERERERERKGKIKYHTCVCHITQQVDDVVHASIPIYFNLNHSNLCWLVGESRLAERVIVSRLSKWRTREAVTKEKFAHPFRL